MGKFAGRGLLTLAGTLAGAGKGFSDASVQFAEHKRQEDLARQANQYAEARLLQSQAFDRESATTAEGRAQARTLQDQGFRTEQAETANTRAINAAREQRGHETGLSQAEIRSREEQAGLDRIQQKELEEVRGKQRRKDFEKKGTEDRTTQQQRLDFEKEIEGNRLALQTKIADAEIKHGEAMVEVAQEQNNTEMARIGVTIKLQNMRDQAAFDRLEREIIANHELQNNEISAAQMAALQKFKNDKKLLLKRWKMTERSANRAFRQEKELTRIKGEINRTLQEENNASAKDLAKFDAAANIFLEMVQQESISFHETGADGTLLVVTKGGEVLSPLKDKNGKVVKMPAKIAKADDAFQKMKMGIAWQAIKNVASLNGQIEQAQVDGDLETAERLEGQKGYMIQTFQQISGFIYPGDEQPDPSFRAPISRPQGGVPVTPPSTEAPTLAPAPSNPALDMLFPSFDSAPETSAPAPAPAPTPAPASTSTPSQPLGFLNDRTSAQAHTRDYINQRLANSSAAAEGKGLLNANQTQAIPQDRGQIEDEIDENANQQRSLGKQLLSNNKKLAELSAAGQNANNSNAYRKLFQQQQILNAQQETLHLRWLDLKDALGFVE